MRFARMSIIRAIMRRAGVVAEQVRVQDACRYLNCHRLRFRVERCWLDRFGGRFVDFRNLNGRGTHDALARDLHRLRPRLVVVLPVVGMLVVGILVVRVLVVGRSAVVGLLVAGGGRSFCCFNGRHWFGRVGNFADRPVRHRLM